MDVYFYPHKYLRDRHLDTIRRSHEFSVLNPEIAYNRRGDQVSETISKNSRLNITWKQLIPLINLKARPKGAVNGSVLYIWGGLAITGLFIVDLDNPWSLTGYNLRAMSIYRHIIRFILLSDRCVEIRCLSNACRESLRSLFGQRVFDKSFVCYPRLPSSPLRPLTHSPSVRFLFVGTQFEIKGGYSLIRAFQRLRSKYSSCSLDLVTYCPEERLDDLGNLTGITFHRPIFSRDEIMANFMCNSDVLVLPTFAESFGMVALEALSCGLAVITTDVYALKEIVRQDVNGYVIKPPLSVWDGCLPSKYFYMLAEFKHKIRQADTSDFESLLYFYMSKYLNNRTLLEQAKEASLRIYNDTFQ